MAIGDVEGHNTSAPVVMGQLRSAVRAYAAEGHDPAPILERANRVLVDLDTDLYATCCCALLDPDTGALQMATAGHPPPAVRTTDGAATPWDLDVGMPLGVDAEVRFEAAERQLAPGTLLAFYTDGLVGFADALDPEALQEAFHGGSLEALGDGLIARFDNRRTRHTDDAALMLVFYEGPSSEARENVRQLRIHRRDLQGAHRTRRLLRRGDRSRAPRGSRTGPVPNRQRRDRPVLACPARRRVSSPVRRNPPAPRPSDRHPYGWSRRPPMALRNRDRR